jgi:hypothetical protein
MATVTHDDLSVCTDCAAILANGTLGMCDDEMDARHARRMAERWQGTPGHLVPTCGDDDEACDGFHTGTCDGCGSTLAGSRHRAAVIA